MVLATPVHETRQFFSPARSKLTHVRPRFKAGRLPYKPQGTAATAKNRSSKPDALSIVAWFTDAAGAVQARHRWRKLARLNTGTNGGASHTELVEGSCCKTC